MKIADNHIAKALNFNFKHFNLFLKCNKINQNPNCTIKTSIILIKTKEKSNKIKTNLIIQLLIILN